MSESAAVTGVAGYVMTGFCVLGAIVMMGFLRALVIEGRKGRRRDKLMKRHANEVGGKQ